MKKNILFICIIFISNFIFSQTKEDFFNQSNEFFKNNVTIDGKVNYAKLKKSPGELIYILDNGAKLKIESLEKETKIAFWINSYNLLIIKSIIENYPLKSVRNVTNFFEKKLKIANSEFTLNEIENILTNLIKDPGTYFVLANGSNGGPKLLNSAYLPETVMYQVLFELKSAINKSGSIKVNKGQNTVEIPNVFELHKPDFVTQYFNQIDFLNIFLENKIDNKLQINYTNFDWTLNEIN